jgi:hypothetical protein
MREPNPQNYTTIVPDLHDLAGTYRPDAKTTQLMTATGKYKSPNSEITLNSDGSININNVPDWWLTSFSDAQGTLDSGRGTWTIDKGRRWCQVVASFPTTEGRFTQPTVPREGHITAMLSLTGQRPPYGIQMTIMDPDAEVVMHYNRVPETSIAHVGGE